MANSDYEKLYPAPEWYQRLDATTQHRIYDKFDQYHGEKYRQLMSTHSDRTIPIPRRFEKKCYREIYLNYPELKEIPELQDGKEHKEWRKVYSHFYSKLLFPREDLFRHGKPCYSVTDVLGEGTYGCVGMFTLLQDKYDHPVGTHLAVKRMKDTVLNADGSAHVRTIYIKRAFRELQFFNLTANMKNHVNLIDVWYPDRFKNDEFKADALYLETVPCVGDLKNVIEGDLPIPGFGLEMVRDWSLQCLEGLACFHRAHICHRDIKPDNILLDVFEEKGNHRYTIKIADYGLARGIDVIGGDLHDEAEQKIRQEHPNLTVMVVTAWYRPWEVMWRCSNPHKYQSKYPLDKQEATAIDVWSIGCCLFELLWRVNAGLSVKAGETFKKRLLKQDHHFITRKAVQQPIKVCKEIMAKCGMPDDSAFKRSKMPKELAAIFKKVKAEPREDLEQEIKELNFDQIDEDEPLLELLLAMLQTAPGERITALEALEHEAFESLKDAGRKAISEVDIIEELLRYAELAEVGRTAAEQNLGATDDALEVMKEAEARLRREPAFYRRKVERYRNILDQEFLKAFFHEGDLDENFNTSRWQKLLGKLRMENTPQNFYLLEFGFRHALRPEEVNMLAVYLLKVGKVEEYCKNNGIEPIPETMQPFPLLSRLPSRWTEKMSEEKKEQILVKVYQASEYTKEISEYLESQLVDFSKDEIRSLFNRLRTRQGIFDTPLRERFETAWLWDHELLKPGRELDEHRAREFLTQEMLRFHKRLPKKDLSGLAIKFAETPDLIKEPENVVISPDADGISVADEDLDQPVKKVKVENIAPAPTNNPLTMVAPAQQEIGTTKVEEVQSFEIETPDSRKDSQETPPAVKPKSNGGASDMEDERKRDPTQSQKNLSSPESLGSRHETNSSAITPETEEAINNTIEPDSKKENCCCIIS